MNSFYINCLKSGHHSRRCKTAATCEKCGKKHHTLLHLSVDAEKAANSSQQSIRAYSCQSSQQIYLMTAIAEVKGAKQARVRVFLDLGAQASFVSSALIDAIKPSRVGEQNVMIKAVGAEASVEPLEQYRLQLSTVDGGPLDVVAWEAR